MDKIYQPLVSIIIPVYNGGNYLREAIDSALQQSYTNIEIIVINDGSTDNGETEQICLGYKDKIRYYNKLNGGSSSALNFGISKMKGDWFSWLSHDDLYESDKLEEQINYINKNLFNSQDLKKHIIYSNSSLINSEGKLIHIWPNMNIDHMNNYHILLNSLNKIKFNGCSFLIPKKVFTEIGVFREDMRLLNDYEFWTRLLINGYKFNYINKALVRGRIHSKQVSKTINYSKNNWEQDYYWDSILEFFISNKTKIEFNYFIKKYAIFAIKNDRKYDARKAINNLECNFWMKQLFKFRLFCFKLLYLIRRKMVKVFLKIQSKK